MDTRPAIRAATIRDAPALAALHVQAWQWAYRELLTQPAGAERTWVAEIAGRVVGFADTGPSRNADTGPATAEVSTLYLDPRVVGTGVGRALLQHAMADLRQRGYRQAVLWVLQSNARARRFYEIAGWRADGTTKTEQRSGVELSEVRYRVDLTGA